MRLLGRLEIREVGHFIACVASFSVGFWNVICLLSVCFRRVRVSYFGSHPNYPVPSSFFAPQSHGNACYVG